MHFCSFISAAQHFFHAFTSNSALRSQLVFFISFSEYSVGDVFANCFFWHVFFPLLCCFSFGLFFLNCCCFLVDLFVDMMLLFPFFLESAFLWIPDFICVIIFRFVVVDVAAAVVFCEGAGFCGGGGFLQWWFLRWWFLRCLALVVFMAMFLRLCCLQWWFLRGWFLRWWPLRRWFLQWWLLLFCDGGFCGVVVFLVVVFCGGGFLPWLSLWWCFFIGGGFLLWCFAWRCFLRWCCLQWWLRWVFFFG